MSLKPYLAAIALSIAALTTQAAAETIKVGVSPGPHAEILEKVKPAAKAKGLDIEIVEFSDYVVPNAALDAGEIDANSFQHQPYLDNQIADRKFDLVSVATTVNFPLGIYSSKHKSWDEVPDGATIAIQNDPTNGGRALLLLRDKGIIKLKDGVGYKPTPVDIVENPKNLKIEMLQAEYLARSLQDVDASVINTNYYLDAEKNLGVKANVLARESAEGNPYANIVAVRKGDEERPEIKKLMALLQSEAVADFLNETYDGAVIPAF